MNPNSSYRINHPAVIAEVIDDEAIIVNLDSGAYYSLRDTGCAVWDLLAQQLPVSEVIAALTNRYRSSVVDIGAAVQNLITELQHEALIIPVDHANGSSTQQVPGLAADSNRPQFQAPVLEKFTDMADLLLLDPIHEVDETGWPHVAQLDENRH